MKHLIKLWETEQLTTEQTIGQILLHLQALSERVWNLERRLGSQQRRQSEPPPPPKGPVIE